MRKQTAILVRKINELDKKYTELEQKKHDILILLSDMKQMEKTIIKLFKKNKHVINIETNRRIFLLKKRKEVDDKKAVVKRLMHHLEKRGENIDCIKKWTKTHFKKQQLKTCLCVMRKI